MGFPRIRPWSRRSRALLAVAFATAAYGTATAHATAKPRQTYELRVGIDNGRTAVRIGDRLTYVTKVSNTGTADSPELLLSQTIAPGLKVISSTPKGELSRGRVLWNRALPAGRTDRFSVTVEVGPLSGVKRLAAVACASTKADKRPIICASHLDLLRTAETDAADQSGGWASGRILWFVAGAAGGLVILLSLLTHRCRRSPAGR